MPSLKPMIAASEAASTSVPDPLVAFALAAAVTMAIGHAASGRAATQQTKDAAALLPSAALASVWVTSDQGEDEEGEYVRDVTGWYVRDSVGAIMWRTDCRPLLSNGCWIRDSRLLGRNLGCVRGNDPQDVTVCAEWRDNYGYGDGQQTPAAFSVSPPPPPPPPSPPPIPPRPPLPPPSPAPAPPPPSSPTASRSSTVIIAAVALAVLCGVAAAFVRCRYAQTKAAEGPKGGPQSRAPVLQHSAAADPPLLYASAPGAGAADMARGVLPYSAAVAGTPILHVEGSPTLVVTAEAYAAGVATVVQAEPVVMHPGG